MARARNKKKSGSRRRGRYLLVLLAILALAGAYFFFAPNTGSFTRGEYLYIRTGSDYGKVKEALRRGGFIRDMASFDLLARQAGYPDHVHPGKYHIRRGMGNYSIVRLLRSGRQTPVKLVIRKLRRKEDFIRLLAGNLEADSGVLRQMFRDTVYLAQFGLDTNTVLCAVLPDTYEFYWNTNADKAFRRIEQQYVRFWTDARKAQAAAHHLTPRQAVILASIVEEETNKNDEKPSIASVYLNRLDRNMLLQADPTAKYAYGDFTLRRITAVQTSFVSPYNTYQVKGLPIGPICTPSAASINAVLQSPQTGYLYFCAREDFSGYHRFAATYEAHLKNRDLFIRAMNERHIR